MIAGAVILPRALAAQAATDRAGLAAFRDSLRTSHDTAGLRALERAQKKVAQKRHDVLMLLRVGFIQLRRAEVENSVDRLAAADTTFGGVIAVRKDWPVAWLGRALVKANLAEHQSAIGQSLMRIVSADPAADAARAFARTGELDPAYTEGLLKITNIALQYRHPLQLRMALLAMRRVGGKPVGRNPAVELARVRIEHLVGDPDSARRIVDQLLAREPENAAALLESGYLALANGEAGGADAWFRGLVLADPVVLAVYRSQLLPVLPDSVLQRFDAAAGRARADVVREFFEADDPQHLRTAAERLREHYWRFDAARPQFALPTDVCHADSLVAFAPTGREMDERGLVWMLHGRPDNRTSFNLFSAPPNETWHYKRSDGTELLFNFVRPSSAEGYRRVASVFDILALSTPFKNTGHGDPRSMLARGEAIETFGASWTAQTAQALLYSRERTSPIYSQMLSRGKSGANELQQQERATGDRSLALGETWEFKYELPLDAWLDAIAVGSDSGGSLIQVSFAIPGTSLYAPPTTGRVAYPIRMRVIVLDGSVVIARLDTLRNFVAPSAIGPAGILYGRLPVRVPPGDYTVRIALETASRGVVARPMDIHVVGPRSTALALSDLALGARSINLPWRTLRGDSLWVNPRKEFKAGEPVQLYFEVAGIGRGASYMVDMAVFKSGDAQPQLRVGFSSSAAATPDAVHRELNIARLKPGTYQLQVTVSTASGQQAMRRREFTVVK